MRDFVVDLGGERRLVQVSESLADPQTRKRQVTAVRDAMTELDLDTGEIVVRDGTAPETIDTGAGNVSVVPAWQFLLSLG